MNDARMTLKQCLGHAGDSAKIAVDLENPAPVEKAVRRAADHLIDCLSCQFAIQKACILAHAPCQRPAAAVCPVLHTQLD